MKDATSRIADKVRGIAAENHVTQQGIADILGIERKAAHARWHGRVPFTAPELLAIATALKVAISRFFPEVDADVTERAA